MSFRIPLAEDLARRYLEDTMVQYNFLPLIRAEKSRYIDRPQINGASYALEVLAPTLPHEAGANSLIKFGTSFARGQAYLASGQSLAAVEEFQSSRRFSIIQGIVRNHMIGALSRLQLGRAYALSGDRLKARAAYQEFFVLWKDADPDIAVLKQAKIAVFRVCAEVRHPSKKGSADCSESIGGEIDIGSSHEDRDGEGIARKEATNPRAFIHNGTVEVERHTGLHCRFGCLVIANRGESNAIARRGRKFQDGTR
jgi:hypothetical protein